ncbi:MAG: serine/threonine protein kinase [Methanoculleus sp. SDB]|nr:MAG: serine/threonine protein kinase [Methanoculleus sp. SDB]
MSIDGLMNRFDREVEKMGVRVKDADQMKVMDNVFDEVTLLALYRLVHKKHISVIGGSISTGKEANVFYGEKDGRPIAIKIYRIRSANFKSMSEYITGDPRFASVRGTKKEMVFTWTRKEYANIQRAREAGVPVPEPLTFDRNILLMEFLGWGETPYPQLRSAEPEDPEDVYKFIVRMMKILYREARLVHGDLSEFNILYGDRPYIIDLGQAVTPDHPRAHSFLARDIKNITRFFSRFCDVREERDVFIDIVGTERLAP